MSPVIILTGQSTDIKNMANRHIFEDGTNFCKTSQWYLRSQCGGLVVSVSVLLVVGGGEGNHEALRAACTVHLARPRGCLGGCLCLVIRGFEQISSPGYPARR